MQEGKALQGLCPIGRSGRPLQGAFPHSLPHFGAPEGPQNGAKEHKGTKPLEGGFAPCATSLLKEPFRGSFKSSLGPKRPFRGLLGPINGRSGNGLKAIALTPLAPKVVPLKGTTFGAGGLCP